MDFLCLPQLFKRIHSFFSEALPQYTGPPVSKWMRAARPFLAGLAAVARSFWRVQLVDLIFQAPTSWP
jgi:hypothetical protein